VDSKFANRPPPLRPCKEVNIFSQRPMLLPLIIQVLDSQTARGSSSFTCRSYVQWETKSGNTNARGRGVASIKGDETFGGTMGKKVIFQEWVIAGV